LEDVDAVARNQELVHRELELRVRIRHDLHRPRVGADHHDLPLDEIAGSFEADARRARAELGVIDHPERAPARVHEHDVARMNLGPLLLQRALQIRERDLVPAVESLDALVARDVHEHAARRDRADVLDAELLESIGLCEIEPVVAVVEEVADADVAEAVELRADLAELAAHELVVIDHLVRAERAERLRNLQAEVARAEDRHAALVRAAELVHDSLRDHALCLEHLRGRDSVRGAALIRRAPARREPVVGLAEGHAAGGDAENGDERDDPESSTHRIPPNPLARGVRATSSNAYSSHYERATERR